jgi:hypothetical protein
MNDEEKYPNQNTPVFKGGFSSSAVMANTFDN